MVPEWMLLMDMTAAEREEYRRNSEWLAQMQRAYDLNHIT